MRDQNIFVISMLFYSVFLCIFGFFTQKTSNTNIHIRERVCRERISGVIMAFIALIWCAKHGQSIFPGERIAAYFMPFAFVCTWLSYFLLDYLAARAFAVLLILIAHYHLHWIFALHPPFSAIASLSCFITGTTGIFIAGKPFLLRDFFRKTAQNATFRRYSVAAIFILGFIYFFTGIYLLVNETGIKLSITP